MKTRFVLGICDLEGEWLRNIEITYNDAFLLRDIFSHIHFEEKSITLFFNLKTNYAL
jgi:hypothetical protein